MANYLVREIDENLYLLRVDDRYTGYFEALWEIPEGITYNAYLLLTREGAVLFDGWKKTYSGLLVEALEELVKPGELRYIVVHHLEPDHSGSLEEVLRYFPEARVVGHRMASRMLDAFPRAKERFQPVGDGDELVVGGERLVFIYTPWLHWPETMMTWIPGRRVLLTCDAFGGYGIPQGVFDDECTRWDDAIRSMKKYVVTVIGHYSDWVVKALGKLGSLGVSPRIIAPGHGLVWRSRPGRVIEVYRATAEARPVEGKVLVLYASMYGTLEAIVRRLSCRLAEKGYTAAVYGFTDTGRPLVSEILVDANDAEALVVALPTYEASMFPLVEFVLREICWKTRGAGRRAVVVSTYGWGGVAAKKASKLLEDCGFRVVMVREEKAIGVEAIGRSRVFRIVESIVSAISGEGAGDGGA